MAPNESGSMPGPGSDIVAKAFAKAYGPHAVDQLIRQAMTYCWSMLPAQRKTPQELRVELQRILDRVMANFEEDAKTFGFEPPVKK